MGIDGGWRSNALLLLILVVLWFIVNNGVSWIVAENNWLLGLDNDE